MENPTTVAVDLSKSVFEVAVERQGRICQRKRLSRRQMAEFFSQCEQATVVMEACGSSHYWGREPRKLGHDVRLLPPQHVRPYVLHPVLVSALEEERGLDERIEKVKEQLEAVAHTVPLVERLC